MDIQRRNRMLAGLRENRDFLAYLREIETSSINSLVQANDVARLPILQGELRFIRGLLKDIEEAVVR